MPIDPHEIAQLRRDLVVRDTLHGRPMTFHSTWGLFCPRSVDEGTRLLLDHFTAGEADQTFEIGCGWGPIGLTLAADAPRGSVEMVDRDYLAVEYANRNAKLNHLPNAAARLGNGFDGMPAERRFNNIVSNLPAKTGKEMLTLLLHDAHRHLNPGGRICLVTVTGLRQFIRRHLEDHFGNYKKLKQGTHYTVALAVRET